MSYNPPDRPLTFEERQLVAYWLERAAEKLETRAGNEIYRKAWRAGGAVIRRMKSELPAKAGGSDVHGGCQQ